MNTRSIRHSHQLGRQDAWRISLPTIQEAASDSPTLLLPISTKHAKDTSTQKDQDDILSDVKFTADSFTTKNALDGTAEWSALAYIQKTQVQDSIQNLQPNIASFQPEKRHNHLPRGWKSGEAIHKLNKIELDHLKDQAILQATKYEVLKRADVEILSQETYHLDEQVQYLHRKHDGLRIWRHNLYVRIRQQLVSARVVNFSQAFALNQHEMLDEVDMSMDQCVQEMIRTEHRRICVRQKLLEHIAGVLLLHKGISRCIS